MFPAQALSALVIFISLGLCAQEIELIEIPPEPACATCELLLRKVVTLGEEDGEGFVDFPRAAAVSSSHYFLVNRSLPTEIRVFDLKGRFERVVGRAGAGPGEYGEIWGMQVSEGDSLFITDLVNLRRTVLSPEFEVARSHQLPTRPVRGACLRMDDGGCLLNGIRLDVNREMSLLHRVNKDGVLVRSYRDSVPGDIELRVGSEAMVRNPVLVDDTTMVVVHFSNFLFGEFDLRTGQQRRLFSLPDRDWRTNAPTASGGVNPGIMDARIDDEDRLWLLVRVGDPNWEDAVEPRRPGFGRRAPPLILDRNGYWDSVVEVIDLRTRRVVVRERFPQFFVRFLDSGGLVGFRLVDEIGAFVEVFDVEVRSEGIP